MDNVINGADGYQYVAENATLEYLYTGLVKVEESFIRGIKEFLSVLNEKKLYTEKVQIGADFQQQKAKPPLIVVEGSGQSVLSEGFGKNKRSVWIDDKEFQLISGDFNISVTIKCLNTTRANVAKISDIIVLGLQSDINIFLKKLGMGVPANAIKVSDRIDREVIGNNLSYRRTTISIRNINLKWQQLLTVDGEVLKDIEYYIEKTNENN